MDKNEELMLAVINMGLSINKIYEHLNQLTERVVGIEEQMKSDNTHSNGSMQSEAPSTHS